MENLSLGSSPTLYMLQGCLIVSVPADLYDSTLIKIQNRIMKEIHSKPVKGVVLDMSVVNAMDSYMVNHLISTVKMVYLLGTKVLFVGFQPGAVSALVDLGVELAGIQACRTLEEAVLSLLSDGK